MRKDILMDLENGDIKIRKYPPNLYLNVEWDTDLNTVGVGDVVYGICQLPRNMLLEDINGDIGINIPPAGVPNAIKISFIFDEATNRYPFFGFVPIILDTFGNEVTGNMLMGISESLRFRMKFEQTVIQSGLGNLILSPDIITDLSVGESIGQNEFLLLTADVGSIYKYPLTGVGIGKYLNGNIRTSDLPQKIQSQFEIDGMYVSSIKYNEETSEIITNTTEK